MPERLTREAQRLRPALVLVLAMVLPVAARAASVATAPEAEGAGADGVPLPVEIHAFASQGYLRTFGNDYLVAHSTLGSFEFDDVAVNVTDDLTDRLRVGIQLFANALGEAPGAFAVGVDWFYLDYHFRDWLGLRVGRTKVPFGLYNEFNDIDSARVPVLLPQSVYPLLNREILLAQTGAELYGYIRLHHAGALDYRLYGGTLYITPPSPPVPPPFGAVTDFQVPYVAGARLLWETPLDGLRFGGSVQVLRYDETVALTPPGAPATTVAVGLPFVLWLASAEYVGHHLVLAAEYGRFHATELSRVNGGAEQTLPTPTNERYYVSAAYHLTTWLTPGVYYSSYSPDYPKANALETLEGEFSTTTATDRFQNDLAVTLRFDVNPYWLVKLEGHYLVGTADLSSAINGGRALATLTRNWGAFFIRTTAFF